MKLIDSQKQLLTQINQFLKSDKDYYFSIPAKKLKTKIIPYILFW